MLEQADAVLQEELPVVEWVGSRRLLHQCFCERLRGVIELAALGEEEQVRDGTGLGVGSLCWGGFSRRQSIRGVRRFGADLMQQLLTVEMGSAWILCGTG